MDNGELHRKAIEALRARHSASGSWERVADELNENQGYLWRIAEGERRCPTRICKKLGLLDEVEWSAQGAWLPDYMIEDIRELGDGNFSEGVRRLWNTVNE